MATKAPPISATWREHLHQALDKAIDNLGGHCDVEVAYGTVDVPNASGFLEKKHTGDVTISIRAPRENCPICGKGRRIGWNDCSMCGHRYES